MAIHRLRRRAVSCLDCHGHIDLSPALAAIGQGFPLGRKGMHAITIAWNIKRTNLYSNVFSDIYKA